jgi:hypothetical protein
VVWQGGEKVGGSGGTTKKEWGMGIMNKEQGTRNGNNEQGAGNKEQ